MDKKHKLTWIGISLLTWIVCLATVYTTIHYQNNEKLAGNVSNKFRWQDTDDCMWVLYAQNAASTGKTQKTNERDNFGKGRLIGWSPSLINTLATLGQTYNRLQPKLTQKEAIEHAAAISNPLLLAISGTLISFLLIRSIGYMGGMLYLSWFFDGTTLSNFAPTHPDHQGILMLTNLGFLAAIVWGHQNNSRRLFQLAGFLGAVGISLSAANSLPIWITVGIATCIALALRTSEENRSNWAKGWRDAGWISGMTAMTFWLIDRQGQFNLALEINGPLHAAALLGGCRGLALLTQKITKSKEDSLDLVLTVIGILPILLTTAIMRSDFIISSDPFLKRIMWGISELQPVNTFPWHIYGIGLLSSAIIIARTLEKKTLTIPVAIALISFGITFVMTVSANRFEASTIFIGTLILAPIVWKTNYGLGTKKLLLSITTISTLIAIPQAFYVYKNVAEGQTRPIAADLAVDAAAYADTINNWEKDTGHNAVLLDPNIGRATQILYYLNTAYVSSTIYWEAISGTKATAAILATADEKTAIDLLKKLKVTHILLTGNDSISTLLLAAHGRQKLMDAKRSDYKGYTGADWGKNKKWLKETDMYGLFEILPQELDNYEKNLPANTKPQENKK